MDHTYAIDHRNNDASHVIPSRGAHEQRIVLRFIIVILRTESSVVARGASIYAELRIHVTRFLLGHSGSVAPVVLA